MRDYEAKELARSSPGERISTGAVSAARGGDKSQSFTPQAESIAWVHAEIYERDLAALRLVPDDGTPSVLLCADLRDGGFVPVFVPRWDIARLLFAGWGTGAGR